MSSDITTKLRADVDAYIAHLHATVQASTRRIELAETLSQRLASFGIQAQPHARLDDGTVLVWVVVKTSSAEQIDAAITKLDLQECNATPGQYAYEMRLKGYDFPIYIYTPTVEMHLLTQIGLGHLAGQNLRIA